MTTKKVGTFLGIFVPNVTMMFGVILFIRLGVIVGHSGLAQTILVLVFSLLIMLITSASCSAIATNMDVGDGGVYYLITRTLGLEIGGALGLAIYLNQLLCITMTISAFAYTIAEVFPTLNITLIELFTLIILATFSSTSAKVALQMQVLILFILIISISIIFFGDASKIELTNHSPLFPGGTLDYWQTFALLYPALTGIEAGMALSGNLKNPEKSLMIGNISSLLFVAITYLAIIFYCYFNIPLDILASDPFIFMKTTTPGWIVTLGICMATLSSALGSFLGAPRILQSMAQDQIVPKIFEKEYGSYREPRVALAFTAICAAIILFLTSIDLIIPIYAMVCLISYSLLNFTAGLSNLINAPSWRPKFKFPYLASFFGAALCLIAMFMINAAWGFISIGLISIFYLFYRKLDIKTSFYNIKNSILFYILRSILYKIDKSEKNALTWHPNLLVLSMAPTQIPNMLTVAKALTENNGILSYGIALPEAWDSPEKLISNKEMLGGFFENSNTRCLVVNKRSKNTYSGYCSLVSAYGLGSFEPNIAMLSISSEKDINNDLLKLVNVCYLEQKNLLMYLEASNVIEKELFCTSKNPVLELWWNSNDRKSSNLMISLASTIHEAAIWKKSLVRINAVVGEDSAKEYMQKFLEDFVKNSRLKIEIVIHNVQNDSDVNLLIAKNQHPATLTMIAINQITDDADKNEYKLYIIEMVGQLKHAKIDVILVSNYDNTEHLEIFITDYYSKVT